MLKTGFFVALTAFIIMPACFAGSLRKPEGCAGDPHPIIGCGQPLCNRGISCVRACGGAETYCNCAGCAAGYIDTIACAPALQK